MPMERGQGRFKLRETITTGLTAVSNSAWQRVHGLHPMTVTIEGTFAGTVKVRTSNAPAMPSNVTASAFPVLGSASGYTSPQAVVTDGPYEWVMIEVSAYSSGTIAAYIQAAGPDVARG